MENKKTYEGLPCIHGHGNLRYICSKKCVVCAKQKTNTNKKIHYNTWSKKNVEYLLWKRAKERAQKHNREFSLHLEDIIIPEYCPVLGIKMEKHNGFRQDTSISIDRIDNSKGYTKDNIRIISWRANNLKSNGTVEEFKKIIKYIESIS